MRNRPHGWQFGLVSGPCRQGSGDSSLFRLGGGLIFSEKIVRALDHTPGHLQTLAANRVTVNVLAFELENCALCMHSMPALLQTSANK